MDATQDARLMQPSAARLNPCGSMPLQGMQGKRLLIISRELNEKYLHPTFRTSLASLRYF
jgi:hypothetical protein